MGVMRLFRLCGNLGVGYAEIVEVEGAGIGRKKESLRGKRMNDSGSIDGSKSEYNEPLSPFPTTYSTGFISYPFFIVEIAILFSTTPVSAFAALISPSVPAE